MSSVANVYKQVINDVIENVKNDFKREGVDESVLDELKKVFSFPQKFFLFQKIVMGSKIIRNRSNSFNIIWSI